MTGSARPMRILILGGTAEARRSRRRAWPPAAIFAVTLSLAGRTAQPAPQPVPVRMRRLRRRRRARPLSSRRADRCPDRRHASLCRDHLRQCGRAPPRATGVPLLALRRPPWTKVDGRQLDRGGDGRGRRRGARQAPRRVFLALGRKELQPFAAAPQHVYLDPQRRSGRPAARACPTRPISPRADRSPRPRTARCSKRHRIETIVAKNSGGAATYGKIGAARALRLPVIMLKRPALPDVAFGRRRSRRCSPGSIMR